MGITVFRFATGILLRDLVGRSWACRGGIPSFTHSVWKDSCRISYVMRGTVSAEELRRSRSLFVLCVSKHRTHILFCTYALCFRLSTLKGNLRLHLALFKRHFGAYILTLRPWLPV